jgi:hypothetical protein
MKLSVVNVVMLRALLIRSNWYLILVRTKEEHT